MNVSIRTCVTLELDGTVYQPGEWITLPGSQLTRAQQLLAYRYVDKLVENDGEEAQAALVAPRTRRKRASSTS